MKSKLVRMIVLSGASLLVALPLAAQTGSGRPRRVKPAPAGTEKQSNGGLLDVVPATGGKTSSKAPARDTSNDPLLTPIPSNGGSRAREVNPGTNSASTDTSARSADTTTNTRSADTSTSTPARNLPAAASSSASSGDTTHAFSLLQQKQYQAAAKEAGDIAQRDPTNAEAWKILGFAKMNLKQNGEAADALQRALDLQRTAKQEDPNTVDALGLAYARSENYDRALPLLTTATSRPGAKPDAVMLYYQGLSAYHLKKPADAELAFNAAAKADPKDAASLFFLGRIGVEKNDYNAAISALNRATLADPKNPAAWQLLTTVYLRRAALNEDDQQKAAADYAGAVRAGEGLTKVKNDVESATLFAQALIQTQQFARAALVLDRFAAMPDASGSTLYLVGLSHSRAKNFPKAIPVLERAAAKTPNDASIFRELGYDYESSKQYAKALGAYQKGAAVAPDDSFFKDSIARVTPYAK